jgi:hypothetical protein
MFAVTGLMGVTTGTALACLAGCFPKHAAMLETIGGGVMIGGFALVGWALPAIV